MGWEEIEPKLTKLRQKIIAELFKLCFKPFVESEDIFGTKSYYCKVHPKVLVSLMFAFK